MQVKEPPASELAIHFNLTAEERGEDDEQHLDLLEKAVPSQGNGQRLPGPVVGPHQRPRQSLAVIREPVLNNKADGQDEAGHPAHRRLAQQKGSIPAAAGNPALLSSCMGCPRWDNGCHCFVPMTFSPRGPEAP